MTSVMATVGGPLRVSFVPTDVPGGAIRLAAAVAWRGEPLRARAARRARGPLGSLRRLRHRLWLRFGPMGLDVHLRGSSRRSGGATFGQDGEDATYYDAVRGEVRVLGRRYRLPPEERALVLLVDYGSSVDDEPRVAVRTVPTVVTPAMPPDYEHDELDAEGSAGRWEEHLNALRVAWSTAIRMDPEVRAFLDAAGYDAP